MQKKIMSGMKKALYVLSPFLLAVCLVSTAAAFGLNAAALNALRHGGSLNNANTNNSSGTNLPNGRPFQILQNEITALQNQVNTMQNQIGTMQYEVLTVAFAQGDAANQILDLSNLPTLVGAKDVRFEITFVPTSGAAPATTADTYIMSAMTAFQNGNLSYIGTNSDGTPNPGNSSSFSTPVTIATINGIGSLAATGYGGYEIENTGGVLGTYYVKIIY